MYGPRVGTPNLLGEFKVGFRATYFWSCQTTYLTTEFVHQGSQLMLRDCQRRSQAGIFGPFCSESLSQLMHQVLGQLPMRDP